MASGQKKIVGMLTEELLQKMKAELRKHGVRNTGALETSLKAMQDFTGDRIDKVTIEWLYYGLFVDMGVGKGVKYGAADALRGNRKPVPFKSNQILWYHRRLTEVLADSYAREGITDILDKLPKIIEVRL